MKFQFVFFASAILSLGRALVPLTPGVVRNYLEVGSSGSVRCVRDLLVREKFRDIRNLYGNTPRPRCYSKGYLNEGKSQYTWIVFVFPDVVRLLPGLPLDVLRESPSVVLEKMVLESVTQEDREFWTHWASSLSL